MELDIKLYMESDIESDIESDMELYMKLYMKSKFVKDFIEDIIEDIKENNIVEKDFVEDIKEDNIVEDIIEDNIVEKDFVEDMEINIFIVCYNESVLLPHTISHYRRNLPNAKITIIDNMSTDDSFEIANNLNCKVINWDTNNIIDDIKLRDLKNNCWKNVTTGWIIMIDMDEWLNVNESDLYNELLQGTTILSVRGIDMIGESNSLDLNDIDLHKINKYIENERESKKLCFLRNSIIDINYDLGAHNCNPNGVINYSSKIYINKHMRALGSLFVINKNIIRYNRSHEMIRIGLCIHYTNDNFKVFEDYNHQLQTFNYIDF